MWELSKSNSQVILEFSLAHKELGGVYYKTCKNDENSDITVSLSHTVTSIAILLLYIVSNSTLLQNLYGTAPITNNNSSSSNNSNIDDDMNVSFECLFKRLLDCYKQFVDICYYSKNYNDVLLVSNILLDRIYKQNNISQFVHNNIQVPYRPFQISLLLNVYLTLCYTIQKQNANNYDILMADNCIGSVIDELAAICVNKQIIKLYGNNDYIYVTVLKCMNYAAYYYKKKSQLSIFDLNNKHMHADGGALSVYASMASELFIAMSDIQTKVYEKDYSNRLNGKCGAISSAVVLQNICQVYIDSIEYLTNAGLCASSNVEAQRLLERACSVRDAFRRYFIL